MVAQFPQSYCWTSSLSVTGGGVYSTPMDPSLITMAGSTVGLSSGSNNLVVFFFGIQILKKCREKVKNSRHVMGLFNATENNKITLAYKHLTHCIH